MVRRAYLMTSLEQYLALAINLSVLAIMARILTPTEMGVAVMGLAIALVAFSAREFVTSEFLIQRTTVDVPALRTALTLQIVVNVTIAAVLFLTSGAIARFYAAPGLSTFLLLVALSGLWETIAQPVIAVMKREMSFGTLAGIRTAVSLVTGGTTILLGFIGVGPPSYAWGMLCGAVTLAVLAVALAPFSVTSTLRPGLAAAGEALAFGLFKGAGMVVDRIYETVPQLILGRIASMSSVALYTRANTLCGLPDRIIMSAFHAMAFPALASRAREGHDLRKTYLDLLAYLSVLYWPGVTLVAVFASSIVDIVLGPQWTEAAPLVRILALAAVFWLPVIVTGPLLLAIGRNRDAFLAGLISRCLAATVLCTASLHGVMAMALSQFVSLPAQMAISLFFVWRHLRYRPRDLVTALLPSAAVTGLSLAGPLAVALTATEQAPLVRLAFSIPLAAGGWLAGLHLTGHIFLAEVRIAMRTGLLQAHRLRRLIAPSGA